MKKFEDVTVTHEEVDIMYPVVEEHGIFRNVVVGENWARGIFDRYGTRLQVALLKVENIYGDKSNHYVISVPNLYFSMETSSPKSCAYKITEKSDIPRADAESIEMAVRKMIIMIQDFVSESV